MAEEKERLDVLVARFGLTESREKAARLILAGEVKVNGRVETKAGRRWKPDIQIEVRKCPRFVGRGGEKLEAALDSFSIEVSGLVCLDIGASTGGFTDCMLQRGALRVYAVDVGRGQLNWRLRNDDRVVVMEKVNARRLHPSDLNEMPGFAAVDVSFISLTMILPAVIKTLSSGSEMVTLIKPQFEAERGQVGRGGVVRDENVRRDVVEKIRIAGEKLRGLQWLDCMESPLKGPAGNVEYLAHWGVWQDVSGRE